MGGNKSNTLEYDPALCNRCGLCTIVCPHGVFQDGDDEVRMVDRDACMECGACRMNCEAGAIKVNSDVGCAYAMIMAALTGRKENVCC